MANLFAYVIGAAMVGMLHMSAPDHWLTLCVLGRNKKWTPKKLFGISFVTAIGHVSISVVIGLVVVVIGLVFSHLISDYLDIGIGIAMVIGGLVVGIIPLVRKSSHHHDHNHEHEHDHEHEHEHHYEHDEEKKYSKLTSKLGYFAVLGAALSPDPSIIPIYFSAISAGFYFALELSIVFAVASILTLLLLVQLGTMGLVKTLARIPAKYNDSMVGFVIMIIGIYVLVVR
jgi:ABC-type nickel/cobalt efflux system permease component RcnA